MATFIGLDLAWTARNETGVCWFEGETPADLTCTRIGACVRGFALDPEALLGGERDGRVAVEVYPHTIHVRLFDLTERIPYKAKAGRSVDSRQEAIQKYQGHLRTLIASETPRVLGNPHIERALSPDTAAMARGAALKHLDDTLDGLTCALAAWLAWHAPFGWEMIGDLNGYIIAPRERAAQRRLLA